MITIERDILVHNLYWIIHVTVLLEKNQIQVRKMSSDIENHSPFHLQLAKTTAVIFLEIVLLRKCIKVPSNNCCLQTQSKATFLWTPECKYILISVSIVKYEHSLQCYASAIKVYRGNEKRYCAPIGEF